MYSQKQIERANETSIMDYLYKTGYHPVKTGGNYELKGFGGLQIDPKKNRWNCRSNPDPAAKGGPIQLVSYLENVTWKDAVAKLIGEDGEERLYKKKVLGDIQIKEKDSFVLPKQNTSYQHIFAYLIKTRKIDKDIVKELVETKMLYENDKKSCVFIGRDKLGEIRYANIRSTNTIGQVFKGEAIGSDKRFGFSILGTGDTVTVFEAPVDALSYMTIFKMKGIFESIKKESLLTLGGVEEIALTQYLKDYPNIRKIQVALDMDEAGERGFFNIVNHFSKDYEIKRLKLPCKDYNQYLIENYEQLKGKEPERKIQQEETKIHKARDEPEQTKDYFECYALKEKEQGKYVVMMLKSNSPKLVPVTWTINSKEQAEHTLDKIITQKKGHGIAAEKLDSMPMLERFREIVTNQLRDMQKISQPDLEYVPEM